MNIKEFNLAYFQRFQEAMDNIETSEGNEEIPYDAAMSKVQDWLKVVKEENKKLIFIGNGGSAGVASHMSLDFWKNAHIRAITFNDVPLISAVANDYAYEDIFNIPIRQFADEGDVLICISSSGGSENVIRGAKAAKECGCQVITCSGFDADNSLRKMGDVNFYVPSQSYGVVETLHQLIIHAFLDTRMYCFDELDIFKKNVAMT